MRVELQNAQGQGWDGGDDPPDIALCVVSDEGTRCYPGADGASGPARALCEDANLCRFPSVQIPSGSVSFRIVDVDLLSNDLVGEGACAVGAHCHLGRAAVEVGDEATFQGMTPAQHLEAGRAAQRGGKADDAAEVRRQLEAIPVEASEHRDAEGMLRQIDRDEQHAAQASAGRARAERAVAERRSERAAEIAHVSHESGGNEGRRMREALVQGLSGRNEAGLRYRATGPNGTTLRIAHPVCNREMLDAFVRGARSGARNVGFRRVECHGGTGTVSEDL